MDTDDLSLNMSRIQKVKGSTTNLVNAFGNPTPISIVEICRRGDYADNKLIRNSQRVAVSDLEFLRVGRFISFLNKPTRKKESGNIFNCVGLMIFFISAS